MSNLTIFLLASLSLLSCAGITYFSLRIFSTRAAANPPRQDAEILSKMGLPSSAAARHQMLNNDPDGVALEKIKAAARMKFDQPIEFFVARWQRRAGIIDAEAIEWWRKSVIRNLSFSLAAALLLGLLKGLVAMVIFAPFLFLTGTVVTLFQLRREGNDRERIVNAALRSLTMELRSLLVGGNDVVTCLAMFTKGANYLLNPEDPVRFALAQALEEVRTGVAVETALRDAARLIEMRNFSALCTYLIMVHTGSPEWKRQFDELIASLNDHDMLVAEQRLRDEKRKFL